jgi:hypothetical protein
MRPSPWTLATAGVCLAGVIVGLHLFARWWRSTIGQPSSDALPRRWSLRSTLAIVGAVVLAFTAGIGAIGVTHQVGWMVNSPEPLTTRSSFVAGHMVSQNNLKQTFIACENRSEDKESPFRAITFNAQGRAMHGWFTQLLPYIEQDQLYKQIDFSRPWDDPVNAPHFQKGIAVYMHPRGVAVQDEEGRALTHYAFNAHMVQGGQPITLRELSAGKGASNTVLAGEAHGNWKPWGHPVQWRDPRLGFGHSPNGFGSPLPQVSRTAVLMADGSVQTILHRSTKMDSQGVLDSSE